MDDFPQLMADIFPDSTIAKSLQIKRTKATGTIINKLGPTAENDVISIIKKKYFSVIVDETTDISTQKSLVLVARVWVDAKHKVCDKFLGLVEVESCSAEGEDFLMKNRIPFENLIGFGAVNASVMMGDIKGM